MRGNQWRVTTQEAQKDEKADESQTISGTRPLKKKKRISALTSHTICCKSLRLKKTKKRQKTKKKRVLCLAVCRAFMLMPNRGIIRSDYG